MRKFHLKKKVKLVKNDHFLENIEGYFFMVFDGLLLFVFDKIPKAMLIWGATTIRQAVRVCTEIVSSIKCL